MQAKQRRDFVLLQFEENCFIARQRIVDSGD